MPDDTALERTQQPPAPTSALSADDLAALQRFNDRRLAPVIATAAVAEEYLPVVSLVAQELATREHAAAAAPRPQRTPASSAGEVAVLSLCGVITPRGSLFARMFGLGSGGLECFREDFREALADDNVSAIVIDVDSPGGLIDMVPETAAEVFAARGTKPIVAVANTMAGSAAYWIAAQADELVVTPSGQVGSIGVFTVHQDVSAMAEMRGIKTTIVGAGKFKTEGSPFEPLSKGAEMAMQGKVDDIYSMFTQDIATARGVPVQAVQAGYGEGRMILADRALALKMVDGIETLEAVVIRLGGDADDAEEPEPDEDMDDDDGPDDEPDDDGPDDDDDDEPEARAEAVTADEPIDRLYGEDRRDRPAWLL